ncbi:hypothetical protein H4S07_002962, partial [Coemansia furcata]
MSGNGNTAGDDPLSSLRGLGAAGGGVDGDTMNIFSSFTNDATTTTTGGGNVEGLGNLAAGTMGGFGMNLGSFDLPGDASGGGVDLSSMQLMNLDDVSLSSNIMGQPLGAATDDAAVAQLMARLLGPNTAAPAQQQQGGLGLSGGSNQAAPASGLPLAGLRSGSESSDDLGDIPLAQLALGQALPGPGGAQQNVAAMLQSQVAMQALAMPVHGGFGHAVLNAGLGDTLLAGLLPSNAPPMQQALPFLAQGAAPIHGLDAVRNPLQQQQQQPFVPMLGLDGAALGEEETAGVHSSILPDTLAASESAVSAHLEVALGRPPADTRELLGELEAIEDRLCALLATASNAIRMITGPRREAGDDGLELGAAKIKPTIKEFMHLAAEVQAAMKYQHGRLAAQGISTQAVAGFMSDVAGFERDLVCWSDAARLLASALNTALSLSSSPTFPVRWRCAYRLRTVELHDGRGGGSYPVVIKGTNLWTVDQARALIDGVSESRSEFNTVDWQKVADGFPDRTPRACKAKYRLLMRDMALAAGAGHALRLAKGGAYELVAKEKEAWTPDDDETLLALHE